MIDQTTIQEAAEALLDAAPPGSKVILFGSYATGRWRTESDLDFLVVEPEPANRLQEMVRLRLALDRVIGPYLIPADVLVVSQDRFEQWRETPGTVYYDAATLGKAYERNA